MWTGPVRRNIHHVANIWAKSFFFFRPQNYLQTDGSRINSHLLITSDHLINESYRDTTSSLLVHSDAILCSLSCTRLRLTAGDRHRNVIFQEENVTRLFFKLCFAVVCEKLPFSISVIITQLPDVHQITQCRLSVKGCIRPFLFWFCYLFSFTAFWNFLEYWMPSHCVATGKRINFITSSIMICV